MPSVFDRQFTVASLGFSALAWPYWSLNVRAVPVCSECVVKELVKATRGQPPCSAGFSQRGARCLRGLRCRCCTSSAPPVEGALAISLDPITVSARPMRCTQNQTHNASSRLVAQVHSSDAARCLAAWYDSRRPANRHEIGLSCPPFANGKPARLHRLPNWRFTEGDDCPQVCRQCCNAGQGT